MIHVRGHPRHTPLGGTTLLIFLTTHVTVTLASRISQTGESGRAITVDVTQATLISDTAHAQCVTSLCARALLIATARFAAELDVAERER